LDIEEAKVVLPELQESAEDFFESAVVTLQQAREGAKSKRQTLNTKRVSVVVLVLDENQNPAGPKKLVGSLGKKTSRSKSKSKTKPNSRGLV
jgi:hypothetical protein